MQPGAHPLKTGRSPGSHGSSEVLGLTRRGHLTLFCQAFATVMLADFLSGCAPARRMAARDWIDRQGELARALKSGAIRPSQWMQDVSALASDIDVAELMHDVGRAYVEDAPIPETNDPRKKSVRFLDEQGRRRSLGFAAALFSFAPHNVITPHGHSNMVSAHLVVDGRLHVRNFDRVRDDGDAMVIRPTRDAVMDVGGLSAMSSERDNIHWFTPQGGRAATFDIVISGIDAALPDYEITAIDPLGGRVLADGTILAPKLDFAAASVKYHAGL